ncbi:MAG: hypothetical protein GAK45_01784 [Pseudomonas citronellolis]|nr:MAG: hypothetical protein GAK45_01784 [Pseudomonas citronellolis]
MPDTLNGSKWLRAIEHAGHRLASGLSEAELSAVERHLGVALPADLRRLLAIALPCGEGFPDWRQLDDPELARQLAWPAEGIAFDVEHNAFWLATWGKRPANLEQALAHAHQQVAAAPRLIPLYGHRYLPSAPSRAGNPVLSVYQTEIILYGRDLAAYVELEFLRASYADANAGAHGGLPFWGEFLE